MTKLSIVILSYNTKDLTLSCLKSVFSQYEKELENNEFEIIVVDNSSTDSSVQEIIKLKPGIPNLNLIQSKENLGFGKGCNLGVKSAKGKYLLFLNSDTRVLDKGFLKMINFLEKHPQVGILGGKLRNVDGSLQPSVGKFYNLSNLFLMLLGMDRRKSPGETIKVDWVSGAALMMVKDVFEKIKGFDEHFFMYVEDMELCYNSKKSGFLTYFYPDVSITHQELGSSNRAFAIKNIFKGILYFYKKHRSPEYGLAKFMLTVKAKTAILVGTLKGDNNLKEAYSQALKF